MQNQNFKDFPAQSHIDLRFSQRDQNKLEKEEALIYYQKNVHLLSNIFSFDVKENKIMKQKVEQSQVDSNEISETALNQMEKQLLKMKEDLMNRISDFKDRNTLYLQRMKQCSELTTQEEVETFILELQQDGMNFNQHPFLNINSALYRANVNELHKKIDDIESLLKFKESFSNEQPILLK